MWQYHISDVMEVNEEYLVYDINGFIGTIGGTAGLFIGFSFVDAIYCIMDFTWNMVNTK